MSDSVYRYKKKYRAWVQVYFFFCFDNKNYIGCVHEKHKFMEKVDKVPLFVLKKLHKEALYHFLVFKKLFKEALYTKVSGISQNSKYIFLVWLQKLYKDVIHVNMTIYSSTKCQCRSIFLLNVKIIRETWVINTFDVKKN